MNKDKNENTGGELPVYEPAGLPDSDAKPETFDAGFAQSETPWLKDTDVIGVDPAHGKDYGAVAFGSRSGAGVLTIEKVVHGNDALQRLIDSGIILSAEGAISWREGHLEHLARVYVADKALALRDYGDDLTVALSADGGTFAALVDKARGE